MVSQVPPDGWPHRYPVQAEPPSASRYEFAGVGGPSGPPGTGRIWGIALAAGAVAYGALLVVHLSWGSSGSAAFRAGEVLPIAVVSAAVVALLARSTGAGRGWPWWAITLSVFAASAAWYAVVEVLPRAANDARAEVSGEADYRLETPKRAGEWIRVDSPAAAQREEQILARFDQAPDGLLGSLDDVVYAEYSARGQGRLAFVGLRASGALQDDMRDSTREVLRDFMAGSGATEPQPVEPGELGGSMSCASDVRGLSAGVILCAWADASTVGQIAAPALNIDEAAAITRDLRSHVTSH